ncbi:MAG: ABC transporter ATP-binding protein [Actinomycetaceae bacterium]|nr:ABC transporter ATP-binding protein [Actinomycetaceae bacterium]
MRLPIANARETWAWIIDIMRAHKGALIGVLVAQVIASVAEALLPVAIGQILDTFSASNDPAHTLQEWGSGWIYGLIALGLVSALTGWFSEYSAVRTGKRIFARIRDRLLTAAMALPLGVLEAAGTGDLLGRTTHDVGQLDFLIRRGTYRILVLIVTFTVTIVTGLILSPALGLILIIETLIMLALVQYYLRRTVPMYRSTMARYSRLSGMAAESIDGADTIRFLRLGAVRLSYFRAIVDELWALNRYGTYARSLVFVVMLLIAHLPVVIIIGIGGYLAQAGYVTIGQVSAIAILSSNLSAPLWEVNFWTEQFQTGWTSMGRIAGVEQVEKDRTPSGQQPEGSTVEVRSVGYAYRDGHDVLHDIDLTLIPGETLAIVGPSGAGKSTLGRLLAGIHPPTTGYVTVGGVPLVDLTEATLRREVALVTQEQHIFVGTIADNLRIASPEATDEQIRQALDAVGAAQWIEELAQGVETKVGSEGVEVSPARAQQIALARILLLDPHTVVLDEATSLMDPSAARTVEHSLGQALEGRTVVAIAHRLHTARDADRIAVMLDGRIVELGSHEDLLAQEGEYASLWRTWNHG